LYLNENPRFKAGLFSVVPFLQTSVGWLFKWSLRLYWVPNSSVFPLSLGRQVFPITFGGNFREHGTNSGQTNKGFSLVVLTNIFHPRVSPGKLGGLYHGATIFRPLKSFGGV